MKKTLKMLFVLLLMVTFLPLEVAQAADTAKLTIHLNRNDGNYADWTLWTWDTGIEVENPVNQSGKDSFGAYWTYDVEVGSNVGVIARKGDWEAKNCDEDTFIPVNGDTEVWMLDGDCTVYTENPLNSAKVTVHYNRTDKNYDKWTLWNWYDQGGEGNPAGIDAMKPNFEDDFGIIWEFRADFNTTIGLITRFGDWEGKNCDDDIKLDISKDTEIWFLENDCTVYTTNPTDLAGERKPILEAPKEKRMLTIHFQDANKDYGKWQLLTRNTGLDVMEVFQTPKFKDDFGIIWESEVMEGSAVTTVIRLGDWEGTSCDGDIVIDTVVGEDTEVWLQAGNCTVNYENPTDLAGERKAFTADSKTSDSSNSGLTIGLIAASILVLGGLAFMFVKKGRK